MAMKVNRTGNKRIYLISGLLFLCTFAGGAFLGMYITQPESQSAPWYPVAGIVLVGIPWFFWLLTFTYSRCCTFVRNIAGDKKGDNNNNNKQQNLTKAGSTVNSAAEVESPVAGRVKFGATTVLGEEDDRGGAATELGEGNDQNDQSISVKSGESELPLTLSMSS